LEGGLTLITNDGSELSRSLRDKLEEGGHTVIGLNLPMLPNPFEISAYSLDVVDDEAIRATLNQIQVDHGEISSFFHIHPRFTDEEITNYYAPEMEVLKAVFLLAKNVQKSICKEHPGTRSSFMTVTRQEGKLGFDPQTQSSVLTAGIKD
jgi:hypothetical protein